MELKMKLKERLLEIPMRYRTLREKHGLACDLDVDVDDLKPYLKELCDKDILIEKIEYMCPSCHSTIILDENLLNELLEYGSDFLENEEKYFECDECCGEIYPYANVTGFVFYDIKDEEALNRW